MREREKRGDRDEREKERRGREGGMRGRERESRGRRRGRERGRRWSEGGGEECSLRRVCSAPILKGDAHLVWHFL